MTDKRTHFLAVQVDGSHRMNTLVPVIKKLVEDVRQGDGSVGIGLVSMLGFEDTAKLLKVTENPLKALSRCTGLLLGTFTRRLLTLWISQLGTRDTFFFHRFLRSVKRVLSLLGLFDIVILN